MAIAATAVSGAHTVWGNKRVRVYDLVFSGNYATGGEAITAASIGLRKVEQVHSPGVARSTDLATANPVGFGVNSAGTSVTITHYEGSAAGTAISEKTNAEAHATGSNIRVTFIGY